MQIRSAPASEALLRTGSMIAKVMRTTISAQGLMLIAVSVIWTCSFPPFLSAQSIDSLVTEARALMLKDPESAREMLSEALDLIIVQDRHTDAVPVLHQLGILALMRGDRTAFQSFNREAMRYARMSGDTLLIANALTKLAQDYRKLGTPDSAVASCLEAIRLYERMSARADAWSCHATLGSLALDGGRTEDAEHYYLEALRVLEGHDRPKDEFIVIAMLQNFYLPQGRREAYADILESVLRRNPDFLDEITQTNAHYFHLLDITTGKNPSMAALRESVALHRKLNNTASLIFCMTRLGRLLSDQGRYAEAYDTLRAALPFASDAAPARLRLYYIIYLNRVSASDYASALEYQQKYYALNDTINSDQARAHIRELEIQYKTQEQERALAQERALTHLRTSQRNIVLLAATGLIGLLGLGLLLLWSRAKLQKKLAAQSEALHEQKIVQLEQDKKLLSMTSMIEGQEAERKRIATDLHDGLGGLLSSIKAQINLLQPHDWSGGLREVHSRASVLVDDASGELRRIAYHMMPSALSRLGLRAAIEDLCSSLRAEHGLEVELQILGLHDQMDETTEIMVYRIVQELCHNVIKHANASRVMIQMNRTNTECFLIVEDNGVGFHPENLSSGPGVGMRSLQSRVTYLSGVLDIASDPSGGTCVTIQFPVGGGRSENKPSLS